MRDIMRYNENSLYYRLNTGHLNYLLGIESSFPVSVGDVLKELREKEFWHELSYSTVCSLVDYIGRGKGDYSPTFIHSIFDNK